jgi:hypothetical protein
MNEIFECISRMAPEKALTEITKVAERLLADLDSEASERFLMNLIAQSEGDKMAGMVHL